MCIRDRIETKKKELQNLKDEISKLENDLAQKNRKEKKSLEAVSYTHLRAHETVLDLVCRLLLEKKNKNTRITTKSYTRNKQKYT